MLLIESSKKRIYFRWRSWNENLPCGQASPSEGGYLSSNQIRSIGITAEPSSLKRDLTRTTEYVTHARPVAETHDAQLLN